MTIVDTTQASRLGAAPDATGAPASPGVLTRLGGLCLATAPVLLVAGTYTSPPQDSGSTTDYVASLAVDRFQTAMSANFFHYSWVLWVFGLLAVLSLLTGRRGRVVTTVLAVAAAVASVQISGLLLNDYFLASIVHHSSVGVGAAVEDDLGTSVSVWLLTGQLAALLVPLTFLALAYARVISWWIAPLPLVNVALIALSVPAAIGAVVAVLSWAPAYVVALHLVTGRRRNA